MAAPETTIALIHASRAAVDPVTHHLNQAEPGWRTVNLLDDGVMSSLADAKLDKAVQRLSEMIELAWMEYRASAVLLTCSAVSREAMRELRAGAKIPVIKIDEPMTRRAAAAGRRIGIVATFPATVATTVELLHAAAPAPIETTHVLADNALQALLKGDTDAHDKLLLAAARQVEEAGIDAMVLAQVSMARLEPQIKAQSKVPVYSSLATAVDELRALLAQTRYQVAGQL